MIISATASTVLEVGGTVCDENSSYKPIITSMWIFFTYFFVLFMFFVISDSDFLDNVLVFNFFAYPAFVLYVVIYFFVADGCQGENVMQEVIRAAIIVMIIQPIEYIVLLREFKKKKDNENDKSKYLREKLIDANYEEIKADVEALV